MKVNYHTHSRYCDGKGEPREYVEYAISHGFSHLGFSSHAPVPFENDYAIKADNYLNYCNEIRSLQAEYSDRLKIHLGLEIDFIPNVIDVDGINRMVSDGGLDYFIGSVHMVNNPDGDPNDLWFIDGSDRNIYDAGISRIFHGDVRKAVTAFFHQNNRMIETVKPPIIGHFDKIVMHNQDRFFHYDEPWLQNLLHETICLIKEYGIIYEINTRGLYKNRHTDFYPAADTIRYMNTLNIPVMVSSDAHNPEEIDRFEGAYELLSELKYKEIVFEL